MNYDFEEQFRIAVTACLPEVEAEIEKIRNTDDYHVQIGEMIALTMGTSMKVSRLVLEEYHKALMEHLKIKL